jgi:ribose 5-phosphate isomerase
MYIYIGGGGALLREKMVEIVSDKSIYTYLYIYIRIFIYLLICIYIGGGGALLREKMVEIVSDKFICIVDESKLSKVLFV